MTFEKANLEKDKNKARKRPIVAGKRNYCSAPNSRETQEQLISFSNSLRNIGQGNCMLKLLEGNNYMPSNIYNTSRKDLETEFELAEHEHDEPQRQVVDIIFGKFTSTLEKTLIKEVFDHLMLTTENCIEIEQSTLKQSDSDEWFSQRKKRLTASNFGAVINRRLNIYPESIIKKVLSSTRHKYIPESCKWGLEHEKNAIENINKC